jgi:hypothetical protein
MPHKRHPWVTPVFVVIALGLVPWTLYLAVTPFATNAAE